MMQIVVFLLYAYIAFSIALLYIMICGGTSFHANGIIGKLNKSITGVCMPSAKPRIEREDEDDVSSWWCCLRPCVRKVENYLFYRKNPLMQLVYVGLLAVNGVHFFWKVYFNFSSVKTISAVHYVAGPVVLCMAFGSFLLASYSNPGFITKENIKSFEKNYEYNVYYPKNRICPTCKIPKLPRSKHCSLTGHCVSRFDHFCPWINNAIGEWNYRYFHLFLISNAIMSFYGVYLIVMYLYGVILRDNLLRAEFMTNSGESLSATPAIVLQYMMTKYMWVLAQVLFGVCIAIMLLLFWGYHFVRMVLFNTTTNESFKIADIEDWMEALKVDPKCFDDEWNDLEDYQKEQVRMLKAMIAKKEELVNPYYKSIWKNILEVVFPPSLQNYKVSKFSKFSKED